MSATGTTRLVAIDDAPQLAHLVVANRADFEPWEPVRDSDYYTVEGQQTVVRTLLDRHEFGVTVPHVIVNGEGNVAGRITLDAVARGAAQSAIVGYWVDTAEGGRGLASTALAQMLDLAFGHLGLHRVEAGTLLHNVRSQRVLQKNGFTQFGLAPRYLKIAGQWQDHLLFQRLSDGT